MGKSQNNQNETKKELCRECKKVTWYHGHKCPNYYKNKGLPILPSVLAQNWEGKKNFVAHAARIVKQSKCKYDRNNPLSVGEFQVPKITKPTEATVRKETEVEEETFKDDIASIKSLDLDLELLDKELMEIDESALGKETIKNRAQNHHNEDEVTNEYIIPLTLQNEKLKGLIDTSTDISSMDIDLCKRLAWKITPAEGQINFAGKGHFTQRKGIVENLEIKYTGRTVHHSFEVME
ncbi:hypothetical protein DFQ30_004946, partial [Apophysomyces sp. BC1015]